MKHLFFIISFVLASSLSFAFRVEGAYVQGTDSGNNSLGMAPQSEMAPQSKMALHGEMLAEELLNQSYLVQTENIIPNQVTAADY